MAYENIMYEKDGNIAIIKFNRPKALNAINPAVLREVNMALDQIEEDVDIRVLILTGAGEKAFIAGADIAYMLKIGPLEGRQFSRTGQELLFRLEGLPIPVIACVNGFALGGGMEFAMACDFIYASENAKFGQPEINLAIIPGYGGTQRLPRLAGKGWAKELCMTGEMIGPQVAKEIGLVNKIFAPDKLWEETMKTAKILASKGRVSLKAIKDCIGRGVDVDLRDGCYMESDAFGVVMTSEDAKEGLGAFLEKRKPEFKGGLL
jgi:enoyl-CoA hydratase